MTRFFHYQKAFFNIGLSINLILFLAIVQVAFSHLLITTEVANTPPPHFSFNIQEKGKNQLKLVWAHVFWCDVICTCDIICRSSNILPPLSLGEQRWADTLYSLHFQEWGIQEKMLTFSSDWFKLLSFIITFIFPFILKKKEI